MIIDMYKQLGAAFLFKALFFCGHKELFIFNENVELYNDMQRNALLLAPAATVSELKVETIKISLRYYFS